MWWSGKTHHMLLWLNSGKQTKIMKNQLLDKIFPSGYLPAKIM